MLRPSSVAEAREVERGVEIEVHVDAAVPIAEAQQPIERRERARRTRPAGDLVEAARLDDGERVGDGGVARGADLQPGNRVAVGGRGAVEAKPRPHRVQVEADLSLVGLEIAHVADQRIALLQDLNEARVDIDRLAARRQASGDARGPAVEGDTETPGVGIDRRRVRRGLGDRVAGHRGPDVDREQREQDCHRLRKPPQHGRARMVSARGCRQAPGHIRQCHAQPLGVIEATTSRLLSSVRLSPCLTRGSC